MKEQLHNTIIEQDILDTLRYFIFFNYIPTFEEIYTFLKKKLSKRRLANILEKMKGKEIVKMSLSLERYTLGEYSKKTQNIKLKIRNSDCKINKIQLYIQILSFFPQIKLVGLSGTVAMMNAKEKDDIDLFIISAKKRIWTVRMISLIIAQFLGLRRKARNTNAKNKVCLNLFFDESNLTVPRFKQTEYVAHEVLQMKPLINKNFTYERFLQKNNWVYTIFPNAEKLKIQKISRNDQNFLGNLIEFFLKKLQLTIIKVHQTNEIVTNTQLWFFPEDFEKKLNIK